MDRHERLARELFWRLLGYSDRADPWAVFAHWELAEPLRLDCLLMAENAMASDWLRDTLAAERRAEKARIVAELRAQADVTPCVEDAGVMSSAADLVEADFSFDRAEEIAAIRNLEPEASDEI